jgi:hypothetical protein
MRLRLFAAALAGMLCGAAWGAKISNSQLPVVDLKHGGTGYSAASLAALRTYLGLATTGEAVSLKDGDGTLEYDNGGDAWVFGGGPDPEVQANRFYGPLTGNVTGNVSGSSGSCTGNAATATTLTGALSKTLGGAGDVTGILKANGSGTVSAAASSDILPLLPFVPRTATGTISGTPSTKDIDVTAHKVSASTPASDVRVFVGGIRWLTTLVAVNAGRDTITISTDSSYAFSSGDAVIVDYSAED